MLKYILPLVIALPTMAVAELTAEDIETCGALRALAEEIMNARQTGASMGDMLNIVLGNSVAVAMVRGAYEEPRYATQEFRQRQVEEFGEEWEVYCIEVRAND